ncbi:hypothetical protein BBJ28_00012761 [Nothophytophthora sp. Chile5]|nr:hypothetical protein BBJ28_00012761 [Nothophytophthora sp. Chile5]
MRTAQSEEVPLVDIILCISAESVHAVVAQHHKIIFQSLFGAMKEIVWDHSEKSVHFVLDSGSASPSFTFTDLTDVEAQVSAVLALPELTKVPEQVYMGVLIGQNLPSPIQQRRASLSDVQQPVLPLPKRRELLRREQPVRNAIGRERLGIEYFRTGYLSFTCSINGDLRGLHLDVHHIRVFPSSDCHDRSACLFSYAYESLDSCEVMGTRLELRFHMAYERAKQPVYLAFQSLEAQYIREAIWYLKYGTYMDVTLRSTLVSSSLASPSSSARLHQQVSLNGAGTRRASALMYLANEDSVKQRIDSCCRVIGCQQRVGSNEQSESLTNEVSASNVMIHINSGVLSHISPITRTATNVSRMMTNGLCDHHIALLSSSFNRSSSRRGKLFSRDKTQVSVPVKSLPLLASLVQSSHYAKMFKFQGQLLKRQSARKFQLKKMWHAKYAALFETPVGGFLCYYDRLTHCPGMTETPKERRVIDLSSVLCIRPISSSRGSSSGNAGGPMMHAFDVVTLYRTWTFAAAEPQEYAVWLSMLTEVVEKHASIAPDKPLRFPVKLSMTSQSTPSEATSLEISSHGVSFCTGHEAEVELCTWYFTDLEKWSVVLQQGNTCCLLSCRSPTQPIAASSPRFGGEDPPPGGTTQDFLFRTADASVICLAIEFYVGKCMAKLEVLTAQYLEGIRSKAEGSPSTPDESMTKRSCSDVKLTLPPKKAHVVAGVALASIENAASTAHSNQSNTDVPWDLPVPPMPTVLQREDTSTLLNSVAALDEANEHYSPIGTAVPMQLKEEIRATAALKLQAPPTPIVPQMEKTLMTLETVTEAVDTRCETEEYASLIFVPESTELDDESRTNSSLKLPAPLMLSVSEIESVLEPPPAVVEATAPKQGEGHCETINATALPSQVFNTSVPPLFATTTVDATEVSEPPEERQQTHSHDTSEPELELHASADLDDHGVQSAATLPEVELAQCQVVEPGVVQDGVELRPAMADCEDGVLDQQEEMDLVGLGTEEEDDKRDVNPTDTTKSSTIEPNDEIDPVAIDRPDDPVEICSVSSSSLLDSWPPLPAPIVEARVSSPPPPTEQQSSYITGIPLLQPEISCDATPERQQSAQDEDQDDRDSDDEASEVFNSCASEMDLVPETNAEAATREEQVEPPASKADDLEALLADSVDEIFEDAMEDTGSST